MNRRSLITSLLAFSFPTIMSGCESAKSEVKIGSSDVKLLTYNVLADPSDAAERVPELMRILERSGADIIALQEVTPWFYAELVKQEWFKSYHAPKYQGRAITPGGLLVLSKQPITDVHVSWLPSRQRRACLIVETKVGGLDCAVATCHLESPLESNATRLKQMGVFFEGLKPHSNVIFLGDFNFGHAAQPETKAIPQGYVDMWEVTNKGQNGYTWNIEISPMAKDGSFPNEPSRRLDRIFVRSKHLKAMHMQILGDNPVLTSKSIFPSDHFGLQGVLKITPNQ